ncbi:conserved protein of unknown function [Xenorhabdus poinarii G6]|uniref:Uncharacterized protein n=1 Tax=Xenorhabdus poinarii G6 TaxID=1354304 RepID=A0A068R2J1_9GAMM|nr:hypothetical protein [Xenorhabdus poinarii]CDG21136.1 conserved protein of unknown function [Xenorhabdus poinarii G6]
MKKRNKKQVKANISRKFRVAKPLQEQVPIQKQESFFSVCEKVILHTEEASETTVEYYFSKAVVAREEKAFQTERQAVLNLIAFSDLPITPLIQSALDQDERYEFSEQISTVLSLVKNDTSLSPYMEIIRAFILSGTKQQYTTYFNCLMGISSSFNKELPIFDINKLSNAQLLTFYEATHRILLDNSRQLQTLEKLTQFISHQVGEYTSQSLLFFESYFSIDRNPKHSIEVARRFFGAPNLSAGYTNYLSSLAFNTAHAAITMADIEEADYWIDYIDDDDKAVSLRHSIAKLEEKIGTRTDHPLNPEHIAPSSLEKISTRMLMILCAFVDGCGDDWGFKTLTRSGKYIFPSDTMTEALFQSLAINGLIKMSISSFNALDDSALDHFNEILWDAKFHLNIIGISDSRLMALPILLEELERRNDKKEVAWQIRKLITTGYFYSAFEYYLGNVDEHWAREFALNEATIERINLSTLSGKDLSYIAKSSIRFTAGQHSIGSTSSNKHTCNTLIGSINRYFDWVNEGSYSHNEYERSKKQPILSSERLLEQISGFTPDDIYNLPSLPQEIEKEPEE